MLGVDSCRGGWVGALVVGRTVETLTAPDIAALVDAARRRSEGLTVVGIDIPVGLPDAGGRQADVLTRRALPGKASSVFTTLTRAAYRAETYAEARAAQLAATGGRSSASAQAYQLRRRILDVDGFVRSRPPVEVIEVHPELSFARMSGAPIRPGKRTSEGRAGRERALAAVGLLPGTVAPGPTYAVDDLLDACAVAWSARRHARGEADRLPTTPERFSDGIAAAVTV